MEGGGGGAQDLGVRFFFGLEAEAWSSVAPHVCVCVCVCVCV